MFEASDGCINPSHDLPLRMRERKNKRFNGSKTVSLRTHLELEQAMFLPF